MLTGRLYYGTSYKRQLVGVKDWRRTGVLSRTMHAMLQLPQCISAVALPILALFIRVKMRTEPIVDSLGRASTSSNMTDISKRFNKCYCNYAYVQNHALNTIMSPA